MAEFEGMKNLLLGKVLNFGQKECKFVAAKMVKLVFLILVNDVSCHHVIKYSGATCCLKLNP